MKAKAKYGLVILLVTVLVLVAGGGEALAEGGGNKVTGGGWITNGEGNKITFGFNARPIDDGPAAEGEFQMVDHGFNTNIHGTFTRIVGTATVISTGTCSIDGEGDYTLFVTCKDNGEPGIGKDNIKILIFGNGVFLLYSADLDGGNIQIHEAEEE